MSWSAAANHKIVDLRFRNTRQDGTIMETKTGSPIWYAEIMVDEKPGEWIGGLVFRSPAEWKGQTLALQFTKEMYEGRERSKFRTAYKPKPSSVGLLTEIRDLLIAGNEQNAKLIDQTEALMTEVQNLVDVVRVAINNGGGHAKDAN
jgi:hypothetical protein